MVQLLAWCVNPIFRLTPLLSCQSDPEEESYAEVHINLSHPIKLTRIAMRQLASENRKGVVLPFASVGGIAGTYNCPLYIATKHGKCVKWCE